MPVAVVTTFLVVLVALLIGAYPTWPHSRAWAYRATGGLGLVLIAVLVIVLIGGV